ncbi:MAG: hypothetical protein HY841_06540 [Bacteroidetes bacterium]|nr:hypothetical protein [Bacteroidota bacterium]
MPWNCPTCNRLFKHAVSYHSCVKVNPDSHFTGKNPNVKAVYEKILKETKKFGKVNVSPVKNGILLKNLSTFLGIGLKKSFLDIEFFLAEETNEFPIYKTFRYTKNKTVHYVRLENPKEVDRQLLNWLKTSYGLADKKK